MKTSVFSACAMSVIVAALGLCTAGGAAAQSVAFSFDNAPPFTSLPVSVTEGGITALLSATGSGFSIQNINSVPIHPAGFSGNLIYPSSVFPADLIVDSSRMLTGFSIMYSPDELACDDSATMRATAWLDGAFVGTTTTTIKNPNGTSYPVGTLSCSFAAGFNRVVVHWDKKGPTCQDYGPIFLADNMVLTPAWPDLGFAEAGSAGMPLLVGSGPLSGGSSNQIQLTAARPLAPVTLVVGASAVYAPFKGGVCVPAPQALLPLTTNAAGAITVPFVFPTGVPAGASIYLQFWMADPAAGLGFAASNAIQGITQ